MLTKYSVKRPFTIFVGVIIAIVFGVVALFSMTPDLMPSVSAPYSVVMTTYPGANAEEIEKEITEPLEQQLATLSKLNDISSVSSDNYSVVTLEFTDDVDMDSMSVDIRDKIDQIEGNFPETASKPLVIKMNLNMMPVTVAAVGMKGKTPVEVSRFVKDNIEDDLEGIEGVASVNKIGMIDEGIQVVLSQDKIDKVNNDVSAAIKSKFADGEGKVKSGMNKAKKGSSKIDKGKKKIKNGTESATSQLDSAISQSEKAKSELENQRTKLACRSQQMRSPSESVFRTAKNKRNTQTNAPFGFTRNTILGLVNCPIPVRVQRSPCRATARLPRHRSQLSAFSSR